ncbi:hypothetical protein AB0A94_15850 [Streptomyces sp. NPDC044984]|uniref:hypothetical protein n=1 Tax=Streptomyces sp. NPDC044984 TaxID=3154335 RepID=UPI0033C26DF0
MLVVAGGAVRAGAVAESDLALVEVLLEVGPLLGGDLAVLDLQSERAAVVEEPLVVGDDDLGEDRDVAGVPVRTLSPAANGERSSGFMLPGRSLVAGSGSHGGCPSRDVSASYSSVQLALPTT